jgi:hypothetical protein
MSEGEPMGGTNPERHRRRSEARITIVSVLVALGFTALYQGIATFFFRDPQTLAGAEIAQGVIFIVVGWFITRSWIEEG